MYHLTVEHQQCSHTTEKIDFSAITSYFSGITVKTDAIVNLNQDLHSSVQKGKITAVPSNPTSRPQLSW